MHFYFEKLPIFDKDMVVGRLEMDDHCVRSDLLIWFVKPCGLDPANSPFFFFKSLGKLLYINPDFQPLLKKKIAI